MSTGAGVGAAANIVGGELQGWAALLDKWAMGEAYKRQAATQKDFANQAGRLFDDRLSGAGAAAAGQEMQSGQQARQAEYSSVNATPLSVQQAPLSGIQNARNSAYSSLLGGQRAKLGSYGDWLQNQWMQNQKSNQGLDQIRNFAQGSANVFPIQMYAAQHSMDDLAAIGQAISSIGGGASNYAALFNSTPGSQQGKYSLGLDPGNEMGAGQVTNDPAGEINI